MRVSGAGYGTHLTLPGDPRGVSQDIKALLSCLVLSS
jgi:hypothetical protein